MFEPWDAVTIPINFGENWMRSIMRIFAPILALAPLGLLADDTICNGLLNGRHDNVIVPDGAECVLSNARVKGNVEVKTGSALTVSGPVYIGGNIQSEGSRSVRIEGSGVTVNGNVQIKKVLEASGILPGTSIFGDFQYEENSGFLFASGSFVRGNFQVFKNSGGATIVNNTIRQNLQCKENWPAPTGDGNSAGDKEEQCAGL